MDNECTEKPMLNDIEFIGTDGLIHVCAWCQKIQDKEMKWHHIELSQICHNKYKITHGICPECADRLRPFLEQF